MDTSGKAEMQDRLARMTKLEGRMANILSQRAGETLFARDPSTPLDDRVTASRERLEKEWLKRDWWLDSDEAYALGYVDEIR